MILLSIAWPFLTVGAGILLENVGLTIGDHHVSVLFAISMVGVVPLSAALLRLFPSAVESATRSAMVVLAAATVVCTETFMAVLVLAIWTF